MADEFLHLLGFRDGEESESEEDNVEEHGHSNPQQAESSHSSTDVSYDASLPAQHTYLGTDLEELSGRTVLEDDFALHLPLLSLPGIVLIPGQTLPLHLFQPATVSMVKHIIEKDRTFGMVNARFTEPNYVPVLATVGTTAEIRSYKEETDDRAGMCTVRVKAIGRQRFKILDTRRQTDGILIGRVQILPELNIGNPLEGAHLPSRARFFTHPPNMEKITSQIEYQGDRCTLRIKPSRRKYSRHSCANFTWWPPWVYEQYDQDILMAKIRTELRSWNTALKLNTMPEGPTEFSYWVAANMPIDDALRLKLLNLNCAVQRLRCELSILERCTVMCCKECNVEITDKCDVFSMSVEGPQGMYVNPGGYVHETLTVYKARGLSLHGIPSTEYSWFPGYAWTIAQCRNCSNHIGWKFTTRDNNLKPDKFWGLCRSSLQPGLKKGETEEEWAPCM